MTISKNLLLFAALGLSMQGQMNAYFAEITLAPELTIIQQFIPTLSACETHNADKVLIWIKSALVNSRHINDTDIITIARIIEKNTTMSTKIEDLLQVIKNKEKKQRIQHYKECVSATLATGMLLATVAVMLGIAYETSKATSVFHHQYTYHHYPQYNWFDSFCCHPFWCTSYRPFGHTGICITI
jgi:hypothetical protein